tara:strand:+ start:233 stop:466 length:234 start_codon:yes stop_codon:yes gene_type:complete
MSNDKTLRKPRTIADLKADPRVARIEKEGPESGVWCAELATGWVFDRECVTVLGETIADVCESIHRETFFKPDGAKS